MAERDNTRGDGDTPGAAAVPPTVVVAIVNYNTADLVIDCLASLRDEIARFPGSTVVVADNASPDRSASRISQAIVERGWTAWASVLALSHNGGFAFGNNEVVRKALDAGSAPGYIWLLNPDTVARPGALAALVAFLETNPTAGIAGSRLEDPDGTQQASAFRFHSLAGELEASIKLGVVSRLLARWVVSPSMPQAVEPFDWVSGASMLVRTEVFRSIGLMDESYFLYFEETDFCLRAGGKGWRCWFVPQSRVVHLIGQSTGVTDRSRRRKRRSAYWFESRQYYFRKNHGLLYAVGADLALIAGTLVSSARSLLTGRPASHPDWFVWDVVQHSAVLRRRRMPSA